MPNASESLTRQGRAITLRPLVPAENGLVPPLWNRAWQAAPLGRSGNPYPLTDALWSERLGSQHHDQSLLMGAFDGEDLVGAVYAKTATSTWQPADAGWLSLLCVDPSWQGLGIGSSLVGYAVRVLRERGCNTVRLGGDADHLLPGIPQEAGPDAWRLARRLGCLPTNTEHDLHLDLRPDLPPAPVPPGLTLRTDRPEAALAFVERHFPGRWAEELATYIAAGATAMTIEPGGTVSGAELAPAQGFCVIFQGHERVTAPGLLWQDALLAELGPGTTRLVGIGPLGVDPAVRGAGAGIALVRGAAAWLKERGATDAIINWTTLTGFYGRLGARVLRTYQRVGPVTSDPLPASLDDGLAVATTTAAATANDS